MRIQSIFATSLLVLTGCSSSSEPDQNQSIGAQSDGTQEIDESQLTDTTINNHSYEDILKQAVRIANLTDIQQVRQNTYDLSLEINAGGYAVLEGAPTFDGVDFLSQVLITDEENTLNITQQQYACPPNGSLTINIRDFGHAPWTVRDIAFDQCNYKSIDYSGAYTHSNGRRSDRHDTFQGFQSNDNDSSVELTGTRQWVYPWFLNREELVWSVPLFSSINANTTTTVSNMDWRRYGIDSSTVNGEIFSVIDLESTPRQITEKLYQSDVTTNFHFSSDATQQIAVSVSIELGFLKNYFAWTPDDSLQPTYPVSDLGTPLIFDEPERPRSVDNVPFNDVAQWQTGVISIAAPDGSLVTARPLADDRTKVLIELNGSSEVITRNWSDGFQVDCSTLIIGCGNNASESF